MVYRFDRQVLAGFLDSASPLDASGVQLLNRDGVVQNIPINQVKLICFVRDWIEGPAWLRNQYAVRPRQQGLWVRVRFSDGELLEATMQNNLAAFDPVALALSPPDVASGVQRVLVPRQALESFEILGVVGSPLKRTAKTSPNQLSIFD